MRKAFILLLAAALLLTACSQAPLQEKTAEKVTPIETPGETESREETAPERLIIPTTVRTDLENLPVATSDMTEEELRQICVTYMELQTGILWTSDVTVAYSYPSAFAADGDGMLHLNEGSVYGGVPYTQAAMGLEAFLDYYDETAGTLDLPTTTEIIHQRFGNNCGTAVFWAWQRVSSTIDFYGTRQMCLAHGCVPVGTWTYDETLTDFHTHSTLAVCQENGEDVMAASYALLKPGDGVTMTVKGTGGHARMVKSVEVVRASNGKVDMNKSTVTCLEQGSSGGRRESDFGTVTNFGGEKQYTFKDLYQKGYLPVTVAELCGKSAVKKGEVRMDGVTSLAELSNASLSATYCIARVDVRVTDENGAEAISAFREGSCKPEDQYKMAMDKVLPSVTLKRNLKAGQSYRVVITARLGNGETLTALDETMTF